MKSIDFHKWTHIISQHCFPSDPNFYWLTCLLKRAVDKIRHCDLAADELDSPPPTVDQSSSVQEENESNACPDEGDAVQAESEQTSSGQLLIGSFATHRREWRAAYILNASLAI